MKQKLTDKQIRGVKESMQFIIGLSDVVLLEWHDLMPDFVQAQVGQIKQRAKRLKEDAEAVRKQCLTLVYPTETEEHMSYEFAYELQRLNKFFSTVEYNSLKAFNDKNENTLKINVKDLENAQEPSA